MATLESVTASGDIVRCTADGMKDLLGERLLGAGKVSPEDLNKALQIQAELGQKHGALQRIGAILLRIGAVSEDALLQQLAAQTAIPLLGADAIPDHTTVRAALNMGGLAATWWLSHEAVPFEDVSGRIGLVAKDPLSLELREAASVAFGQRDIKFYWCRSQQFLGLLAVLRDDASKIALGPDRAKDASYLRELAEEAPVIEFVNNVLAQAVDQRASDIHIEPAEHEFEVRFRVDGLLATQTSRPRDGFDAVASRIKLISGLDIAERRLPQDGRVTTRVSGVAIDIRVSSIPGVHGESLVLRLLPKERADLSLQNLGMEPDHLQTLDSLLRQPNGIILVTGPTGSGKSTTLYAALSSINDRSLKIVTVEDPVEYRMSGITQIQTHTDIGFTFSRALRSILRHDPDVIMIGEIRDAETAEIAIQAALTGHLVLATIHTNDAPSAFTRLIEMGIEPFLLATSVRGVLAQRLVRKLVPGSVPLETAPSWLLNEITTLRQDYPGLLREHADVARSSSGTPAFRGRQGIYELLTVTPALQDAILRRASAQELAAIGRGAATSTRFRTLRDDALIKIWHGATTIEEALRVAGGRADGTDGIDHTYNALPQ